MVGLSSSLQFGSRSAPWVSHPSWIRMLVEHVLLTVIHNSETSQTHKHISNLCGTFANILLTKACHRPSPKSKGEKLHQLVGGTVRSHSTEGGWNRTGNNYTIYHSYFFPSGKQTLQALQAFLPFWVFVLFSDYPLLLYLPVCSILLQYSAPFTEALEGSRSDHTFSLTWPFSQWGGNI